MVTSEHDKLTNPEDGKKEIGLLLLLQTMEEFKDKVDYACENAFWEGVHAAIDALPDDIDDPFLRDWIETYVHAHRKV